MSEHDLVIRGGSVIDGTGAPARSADVAIDGDVITAVGARRRPGPSRDRRRRCAGHAGLRRHPRALRRPGDLGLSGSRRRRGTASPPSVMSNCGVGFAPVRPNDRDRLIEFMEGVEDIPGTALHEGITWEWESFPDYLDALDRRPFDIDLAAQVPHGALRLYVMGDRGARGEPATEDDIAAMADLAAEAVAAGALGFTTSRTRNHRSSRGEPTPSLRAERRELVGIAEALGALGQGVLQVVSDFADLADEFATVRAMAAQSGRPISISVAQSPVVPDQWRDLLDAIAAAERTTGLTMTGQVAPRPGRPAARPRSRPCIPFLGTDAYREIADAPARRAGRRAARSRRVASAFWPRSATRAGPLDRLRPHVRAR